MCLDHVDRRRRGRPALFFTTVCALSPPLAAVPPGDYIGWAYEQEGGDFPLRLSIDKHDGKPRARLSFPHLKAYLRPCEIAQGTANGLVLRRPNSQGKLVTYTAALKDRTLVGEASLEGGKDRVDFELHLADEPITMAPLDKPDTYRGTYGGDNRTIVVSSWFWGELQAFDTMSGRTGTLLQTPQNDFIMGPAMYVPDPVFARFGFDRDASGQIAHMRFTATGQAARVLKRIRYVESDVSFESDGSRLEGTLVTPGGNGRLPLIVVMGGSDWTVRTQVRREADIFASFGMAAFTFDARGNGKSAGDPVHSFEQTARDVCAAIQVLKRSPEVDATRVGAFGRSRGGWFAPLAASVCDDIAFVVIFVPPAISPAEQETTRRLNVMRGAGFKEAEVGEAAAYLKLQFDATDSDAAWERYAAERDRLADRRWMDIAEAHESRDSDDFRWCKLNMKYDPLPALEKVRSPLLALFGEQDENVTPAQNVDRMRGALEKGGNRDITLKVLPHADHGLRPRDPGTPPVPLHRAVGYVPEVWTTVREWLAARSLLGPRATDQ